VVKNQAFDRRDVHHGLQGQNAEIMERAVTARLMSPDHPQPPPPARDLAPVVYDELRRLAAAYMRRERPGQTLQATALVHEAYMRLAGAGTPWHDERHFVGIAARSMRQILVERARARGAQKRWAGLNRVSMTDALAVASEPAAMLPALDDALTRLEEIDAEQARIVELRYFAGLTGDENTMFTVGLADFSAEEKVDEGLGPRFNFVGCAGCHQQPATGGTSPAVNPLFRVPDRADLNFGGNVIPSFITPNGQFYRVDVNLTPPSVDEKSYKLTVDGTVNTPLSLTYADLRQMPPTNYLPGMTEAAARLLDSAPSRATSPESLMKLGNLGFAYMHVGAPERVMEFYEDEVRGGYFQPISTTWFWHPSYDSVRKTARFKAFARDAGLVEYWRARGWPAACHPVGATDFTCG